MGRRAVTSRTGSLAVASGIVTGLALLRELIVAARFGLSPDADAFAVSLFAYETVYNVPLTGLGFAVVPMMSRHLSAGNHVRAAGVAAAAWVAVAAITAVLVVWIIVAPGQTFGALLGGADAVMARRDLFRALAVGLVFSAVSGVLGAVLNAHERFLAPVAARFAFTVSVVLLLTAAPSDRALDAAGAGLLGGAILQWLLSAASVPAGAGFRPAAAGSVPWTELRAGGVVAVLGLATFLVHNTALGSVERALLARAAPGDVAAASLAQRSTALLALVAASLQTVSFSRMARAASPAGAVATVTRTLVRGGVILLPALVALILFAEPVVRLLFERGNFGPMESLRTAELLRWYCAAVVPGFAYGVLLRMMVTSDRWGVALGATVLLCVSASAVDVVLLEKLGASAIPIGNTVGTTLACVVCGINMRNTIVRAV
jgi:putative peptidoglycan lipid II flippase